MSYIKIYNEKMIPIGVANTESIEVVEGAQRYAKVKNENGIINGAVNIDDELTSSEIARLVTLYDDNMMPIGMADIEDVIGGHDYSKDYLTFEALEDGTFKLPRNALQYSIDGGETWETLAANTATPTITAGSKIIWKQTGLTTSPSDGIGTFSATGNFNASGNIMSLYYGDDFVGQTDLTGKYYAFTKLFANNAKLVSTTNLVLPATTLAQNCYGGMFYGCTSLTSAPELPATTLAQNCYSNMLSACSSLDYLKILYTGNDSPGAMDTVSSDGDLYLYSQSLASNNNFLKGFNGWRLYLNDEYQNIIDVHGGGCGCGCGC